jgi:hypothetical protein
MAMRPNYEWERLYTAAILETNRTKLIASIDAAQAAIESRVREMKSDHGGSADERLEIDTAQTNLNVMRKRV